MSEHKLWIRAKNAFHVFGIDLIIMGETTDGRRKTIVKDIIYEDVEQFTSSPPKAITIEDSAAKQLMDDMWLAGIRPSKELYGNPDKEDIKNHLEDMRRIVFNGITINLDSSKTNIEPKK